MTNRKKYCVANFKMHKTEDDVSEYIIKLWEIYGMNWLHKSRKIIKIICPPFTSFSTSNHDLDIKKLLNNNFVYFCAQNMHYSLSGAYTGEISPKMLLSLQNPPKYVMLGHSERRQYFNETNEKINKKVITAINLCSASLYLKPILCIGESLEERKKSFVTSTLKNQLLKCLLNIDPKDADHNLIIAYEPIWAIGTGETATSQIITETHKIIRKILNDIGFDGQKISILYGGSVNRNNAKELIALDDVDGFLIGGASLEVEHFHDIYKYTEESV